MVLIADIQIPTFPKHSPPYSHSCVVRSGELGIESPPTFCSARAEVQYLLAVSKHKVFQAWNRPILELERLFVRASRERARLSRRRHAKGLEELRNFHRKYGVWRSLFLGAILSDICQMIEETIYGSPHVPRRRQSFEYLERYLAELTECMDTLITNHWSNWKRNRAFSNEIYVLLNTSQCLREALALRIHHEKKKFRLFQELRAKRPNR